MGAPWSTVIFDQDGTLLDSLPLCRNTYEQVFRQFDLPWNDGEVMGMMGVPLKQISQQFAGDRWEDFMQAYSRIYQRDHDAWTRAFDGALPLVKALHRQGRKLGIVTGKRHHAAIHSLMYTGIWPFMSFLVGADDLPRAKPFADPLLKAAELAGTAVENCVYVGDGPFDMQAAAAANMASIGVTWGMAAAAELEANGAGQVVDSWAALARALGLVEFP
ncbi:HAD family hydrolase [Heliophilum fasciatum]|uniref:Pyrophosphatase PpaX n=1 Tax=Heliophilum fasciatum TaxID=35700 RepID=A0A4R2RS21_9FIRM|nr:HAD-IA family hydrolase [Heliophilum fasciatum]MCW2278607.1 pyrophosphatase PpaX [Heliophilum fasciatum]TCP62691.1 pyrophosphatase PpaX [Heliophilum fasciatum]